MYPRRSPTTHTEQLGDEASVYDWARAQVHALNPTAAHVWRQCDGATSPDAIAAALRREMGIAEADAVVDLTLRNLARLHLLELPGDPRADRPARTRRWLLGRGVAAAMLPAICSIVAPTPVDAQSPAPGAPTLTSLSPNEGTFGTTVAVTLTGTNFVAGGTAVDVAGGSVTVTNVKVSSSTSLTADFMIDPAAAAGSRTVTVTTAGGTSGAHTFRISVTPRSATFTVTRLPELFTVPAGVVSITIQATGAQGGRGVGTLTCFLTGVGGPGGRTTATVAVTPGATLTVLVGGAGELGQVGGSGGFNGGGNGSGTLGGGGGGASSVFAGATPLVIAGGGGGGGAGCIVAAGHGGSGGGLIADPGVSVTGPQGGGGGGGGTQVAGGAGGAASPGGSTSTAGTPGVAHMGGTGGQLGGGGGGGGYFGGGGGGGGNPSDPRGAGGGGGSSFTAPGSTAVVHEKGIGLGDGLVIISW